MTETAKVRRGLLAAVALLLTSVVAVAPWGADRAHAAPVFSFDLVTRSCPDFVQLMPVFASTPGLNYTIEFTVTVRGDAASRPAVTYEKDYRGYEYFTWQNEAPTVVPNVDWNALGANPRVVVTSTYGLNTDAVTTVVGPSYTFPLTAVSHPMLTRGTGTVADPFLVGTPTEVWNMGCYAAGDKHFRFDSDVDLAGFTQFLPLGTANKRFNGSIDGAGRTLRNLRIVNPNIEDLGFVGMGDNGLFIDNLRFETARVEGRAAVGVVIGRTSWMFGIRRVSVVNAQLSATEYGGLMVGDAEHGQITASSTTGTVSARPDTYTGAVGDNAAITENGNYGRTLGVGGLLGTVDDNVLVSDVVVNHTVNAVADRVERVGGLVGELDTEVGTVTRVSGSVVVDITTRQVGTGTSNIGGLFGGQGLEEASFTNSNLNVDMVVRASATSDAVRFEEIGAVVGQSGKSHYDTLKITGTLTVDARPATGDVSIKMIGGFGGEQGDSTSYPSLIKNVDVDVDVTVLGDARTGGVVQPIQDVGAFAGNMRYNVLFDVVASGSVAIAGRADRVGGLVGQMQSDGAGTYLPTVLNGVVYRGSGVQVGGGSTNVGPVWGTIGSSVLDDNAPFTNVWWDSDRNGITSAAAGIPARPATSAELGTWSWLQARGFDMSVWCVAGGVPSIIPLTPGCVSPLPAGVPDAPGQPTVAVSGASATVTWTAPANPGASAIIGYIVTAIPGGSTCTTTGDLTCIISGLANGTYSFVAQAQNVSGNSPRSMPSMPVGISLQSVLVTEPTNPTPEPEPATADGFVPVTPTRVLDTRADGGAKPGVTQLRLASRAPAGAVAVVLNVTSVNAEEGGYVTVYPCGMPVPYVSNVNFGVNATVANSVMTGLGDDGSVCVHRFSATDVVVDITGWFTRGFVPAEPERAFDTRVGSVPVAAGSVTRVPLVGVAGLPGDASGVALNVTSDRSQGVGYLTVFDCDTQPGTSSVNYVVGGAVANLVVTAMSAAGEVCVYSSAATDVIVDVFGWFHGVFTPVAHQRLLDTRMTSPVGGGQVTRVQVAGVAGVPTGAAAVSANVTAVDARVPGFAVVYPCAATPPRTSNLNFAAGQTVANSTYFGLDAAGGLCLYTSGTSDYLVDVTGWFTSD